MTSTRRTARPSQNAADPAPARGTVLLVGEAAVDRESLERRGGDAGFGVRWAHDGFDAVVLARAGVVDAIVVLRSASGDAGLVRAGMQRSNHQTPVWTAGSNDGASVLDDSDADLLWRGLLARLGHADAAGATRWYDRPADARGLQDAVSIARHQSYLVLLGCTALDGPEALATCRAEVGRWLARARAEADLDELDAIEEIESAADDALAVLTHAEARTAYLERAPLE